jgi:carboxypeptidase-like protein
MTEGNKDNNHYTAADIQKYLEGKLSASEMHALEKAALDDSFLSDAIDGMQNSLQERGPESIKNEVTELNESLHNKIKKKEKVIALPQNRIWQRIAAAVVILVGSSVLIYNYVIKDAENNKAIAIKKVNGKADSAFIKNNSLPATSKNDSPGSDDLAATEKKESKEQSESKPKLHFFRRPATLKKASLREKVISLSKEKEIDKTASLGIAKNEAAKRKTDTLNTDSLKKQLAANSQPENSLQGKAAGLSVQDSRQANNSFVQGIVIDNNKNPVAGATVMAKNKKNATSTDAKGFFKLKADNREPMTNVVVNSLGFESTNVFLDNKNDSAILIQLQPSTRSLNEVVVVGYSAKKEGDDNEDETASSPKKEKEISFKAEPSVGWHAFNDYINENKKITTVDSTIKGKEILSFVVDTANKLSSFKIKKTLSPAHDAEAIRLLKQGPAWKLLKRKKAKVTLAIEF